MSTPLNCCTPCQSLEVTQVPGVEGAQGEAGADGAAGVSAFTLLTGNATIPAINATVAVTVANQSWASVGQVVFLSDGVDFGTFRVASKTGTTAMTLTFLGAPGDGSPGAVIGSGGTVSPAGAPQSTPLGVAAGGTAVASLTDRAVIIGRGTAAVEFAAPGANPQPLLSTGAATNPAFGALNLAGTSTVTGALPVANGGTGQATIQAAITGLGLKKTPITAYAAGTAYQFTNTAALLDFGTTDPSIVLNAAGTYLLFANVRVDYNAATFAAVRTGTLKLRRTNNTAADLTGASRSFLTDIITTLTYTLGVISIPPVVYVTTNSDDIIQLWGDISVVPSAGSLDAVQAEIVAVRLFDQTL